MQVRRTLPQRGRSLIGAWCFIDHYGPDAVTGTGGMIVPPHPHTGLQTVSWLFAGEIDHRDSVGSHAVVRPGELNLMTAGSGIQHSEVSLPQTTILHGAQLWIALPDATRHSAPFFERFVPEPFEFEGARIHVFLGQLLGHASTAKTFTKLVGAQLDVPANATVRIPVDPAFEHGVLVDAGSPSLDGTTLARSELGYLAPGRTTIEVVTGHEPLRALLIGGEPLGEQIVMWWNFIGRSHEEIVEYRRQWQVEVIGEHPSTSSGTTHSAGPGTARSAGSGTARSADSGTAHGRFGHVEGYDGSPLPAPELPNVRLQPRE